ncbi:MAG: PadR family transcriptional regulator [Bryobacteraceae bacterium]
MSLDEGSMNKPRDLVQGTVDLLILKTITPGPLHGWAIAQRIKQVSKDVMKLNQNALYPALHRLEEQGRLKSEWDDSENNRRVKCYSLTKASHPMLSLVRGICGSLIRSNGAGKLGSRSRRTRCRGGAAFFRSQLPFEAI